MLNADTPVPAVRSTLAQTYGQLFHNLLSSSTSQFSPKPTIDSVEFDVVNGKYPPSLANFDAIMVSGSANSAYDDLAWVKRLDHYIREVYYSEPRIKIFGSCFGHQIVCQSLLRGCGVRVEKDPHGWELGVHGITLHREFRECFSQTLKRVGIDEPVVETLKLQFIHHDHVVVPHDLPAGWMTLGITAQCAIQGVYQPGRILTTQGHCEFDRFVSRETVKYFFPDWTPDVMAKVLEAIDKDDDAVVAARMVLSFFLEQDLNLQGGAHTGAQELHTQSVHGVCRDECEPSEKMKKTVITP